MRFGRLIKGKRVFLCGNGGSAANAIHVANDLVSVGVAATPLCGDIATLTAIANDFGYEHVFSRQIEVHGRQGDVLIVFSGSGKSSNCLKAVRKAKVRYMTVIAITGDFTTKNVVCDNAHYWEKHGKTMQEAENYQLVWGHRLMKELCARKTS